MLCVPNRIMYCSGKLDEAIEHLTQAILLNPTSAIMYATRGKFDSKFPFKQKYNSVYSIVSCACSMFYSNCIHQNEETKCCYPRC